jgi:hypothetical protein
VGNENVGEALFCRKACRLATDGDALNVTAADLERVVVAALGVALSADRGPEMSAPPTAEAPTTLNRSRRLGCITPIPVAMVTDAAVRLHASSQYLG